MTLVLPSMPPRPWRSHPRETVAAAVLSVVGLVALGQASGATTLLPDFQKTARIVEVPDAPPAALPTDLKPIDPESALAVNARIPIAGAGSAASPFSMANASAESRARALECLTSAIYYEAGQESSDGQRGVAQVILNRVRHPAFPSSVCGVVYEGSTRATGCQFTFTCDGSMTRRPVPALWNRAQAVAQEMLAGHVYAPAGHATHYHANYVVPYWASSLVKTTVEGAHIFYRWAGGWGQPSAFTSRWSRQEANPAALRLAALSVSHVAPVSKAASATVDKLEAAGAKVTSEAGGRVRVHFSQEAREAVEKVKVTPYVERVAASENLRYALGAGDSAASNQAAFGGGAGSSAASN